MANVPQKIDDYDKFTPQAYALQEEITSMTKELDQIQSQIEAEEKSLLEKHQNSLAVQLHVSQNLNQFYEKTTKSYEKVNFKFQSDQLERRTRENETLHESFQINQKLYSVVASSNILTDELNSAYESLRDGILFGRKKVLFLDALMSTPVHKRFNDLRTNFYMPFTTTPLSSRHTKFALVKSVTPVSRHLREKLHSNAQATEIKVQPK